MCGDAAIQGSHPGSVKASSQQWSQRGEYCGHLREIRLSIHVTPLSAHTIGLPSLGVTANPSSGPSMRAAAPLTLDEARRMAQRYDADYERARLNHDVKGMQMAASNLDSLIRAFERMLSDKRRLEDVREEILRNSRNIAPIIRRVERQRPVRGPDGRTARQVGLDTYVLEDLEESESEREEAE